MFIYQNPFLLIQTEGADKMCLPFVRENMNNNDDDWRGFGGSYGPVTLLAKQCCLQHVSQCASKLTTKKLYELAPCATTERKHHAVAPAPRSDQTKGTKPRTTSAPFMDDLTQCAAHVHRK